jgi:hypothetical protein
MQFYVGILLKTRLMYSGGSRSAEYYTDGTILWSIRELAMSYADSRCH